VDYAISQALEYLKLRSLELVKEELEAAIAKGNTLAGESAIASFSKVSTELGDSSSLLYDAKAVIEAFLNDEDVLFTYRGALGEAIGPVYPGNLLGCIAPPKRGKTHFLIDSGLRLMEHSRNVIFFSLEMTKKELYQRFWQALNGSPVKDYSGPSAYFATDDPEDGKVKKWEIEFENIYRPKLSFEGMDKTLRRLRLTNRGDVRMICTPMYTTSVEDIISHIDNLMYYENFIPDAIIIDYADLIKPSAKAGNEVRHQLNDIWMNLRNLGLTRNLAIITATQTNRAGLNSDIDTGSVAEDMRKLAHVTTLVGLNQTPEERSNGIMRVSHLLSRNSAICSDQVVVLQNLHCGKFYLDSRFRKDVAYNIKDVENDE
jgi:hypothetical protein